MREHIAISLLVASALVAASALARAQVYRWVDKQGTVNYSSTPPASEASTSIKAAPAMRFSVPCSTVECFDAEAARADWGYLRDSAALTEHSWWLRYRDEQATSGEAAAADASAQRQSQRARLVRRCERLRMVDCKDDLTLERLEAMDRPGMVLRGRSIR